MADTEILELEDFALELAHTAGGIAQAHFRRPVTVENKSATAFDPVTNADRAIERVLRTAIDARVHDRLAALGLADRAHAPREAVVRPARSARAGRAVLRRAERQLAHQARAARSFEKSRVQVAREGDARVHASRHVRREESKGVSRRQREVLADALRRRLLQLRDGRSWL